MKNKLKEIIFPPKNKEKIEYDERECPNCKQKKLVYGSIPCPESKIGCCVMHYGMVCHNCNKYYSSI